MHLLRRSLAAILLLAATPVVAEGDANWFYKNTDIARDPAWRFGTLPNGLRYAVRQNQLPAGQVSIRLRIDAGSLHEADAERGWAHFVEHMAFRGTEGFGDGEARETWQRLGASFGSDTNASTEPTQTVYQLDLPKNDEASLDTSLRLIAEMADKANFDPKLIEVEKGVVLSERGRRTEISTKLGDLMRPLFFAGLKYADRDTIGTEETLKAANAPGLKAFYERWYRPERATLVMVGDADPALLEALAAKHFGGWKGSGAAPAEPEYGKPADVAERTAALSYPGSPHLATLSWVRPYEGLPPTKAREKGELAEAIAKRILNRRLEAKARGEASFLSAQVGGDDSVNVADYTQVQVMAKEGRWKEALAETYGILADALNSPPSATEIAREMQNLRTSARAAVEGEATAKSPSHAGRLISAIDGNSVISTAAANAALIEELAPAMTPAFVEERLKALFTGSGPRVVMLSPAPVTGIGEALAAAEKSAPAVRAAERTVTMNDLPALGKAGREVSRQQIADLGVTIVRFSNGSSLVFKKTDFEQGRVNVGLRFGTGISGLPSDRKTLAWMGNLIGSTGVAGLDLDALERLLTGRRMSLSFGVGEDAFEMGGTTNAAELPDQLRLLASKIAFPRWDSLLFGRYRTAALENYDLAFSSAASRAGREFGGVTRRGDARWTPTEKAEIAAATPQAFERMFAPLMRQGPIEAVIVGDVDLDTAVKAMLGTVAALPKRAEVKAPAASLKVLPPAPMAKPVTFSHRGDPNQAYALLGWSTFGGVERMRERRALQLAGNMVQVRLFEKLRDVEGATYSPSAGATSSETFKDWGLFYTAAEIRPERADLFFRLARETVADLAAAPVEADEFTRAINPVLSGVERRMKTNGYWLSAMEGWSRDPRLIDQTRTILSDYRSMTAAEVRDAVARHVRDEGDWSILVLPARLLPGVH
ncbi:MAG TPA: insulinase family protein [Allosphingosinicella sp.]|jgi:zinc protease